MMPHDKQFVPTGVPGLDHVLMGGFVREGFYLVQGDPGAGKTTLALQYVLGRKQAGERCLYITLTESHRDLQSACSAHGWVLDSLEICDLSKSTANLTGEPETSVFHPSETELGETTQAILSAVKRSNPQHVVFDGLSELRLLSGNPLIYRRQLLALKEFFVQQHATVLLLDDRSSSFEQVQPESLVGGNIVLERFLPQYGRARRRMYATKVGGELPRGLSRLRDRPGRCHHPSPPGSGGASRRVRAGGAGQRRGQPGRDA
jgi:circadian clock protein KaiC